MTVYDYLTIIIDDIPFNISMNPSNDILDVKYHCFKKHKLEML